MDCLARREHSVRELNERLHKAFPELTVEVFEQVIAELQEDNLQSDARFAEAYVRHRTARGHGDVKIRFELLQRGIADHLSDTVLQSCNWYELAEAALIKKFDGISPENYEEKAQMARFLQQRGFAYDVIEELIDLRQL